MDGMVCGSVTVSSCTLPLVMVVEVSHCPDRDRVWKTSVPHRSSSVTEARVTAITTKPKPPSGWCPSRTTSSSSDRSSKRSRLATCSAEYLGAKCASAIEHHLRVLFGRLFYLPCSSLSFSLLLPHFWFVLFPTIRTQCLCIGCFNSMGVQCLLLL